MPEPLERASLDTDSSPKTLSTASIGALRAWLQAQRNGALSGHALAHGDVRRAMRMVCDDVRQRGIPVERLIILLKEQWLTLTDDGAGSSTRSRDALEEIIRTCIDEFYASTANVSAASPANGSPEATAS
jgi:hypothetical protein